LRETVAASAMRSAPRRDLRDEVGAITTLMAIDALDADEATAHIVLISKPPAEAVARAVLDRVARSEKSFTICFLGAKTWRCRPMLAPPRR